MQIFTDKNSSREESSLWSGSGVEETLKSYEYDMKRVVEHSEYITQNFKYFHYYEIKGHKPLLVGKSDEIENNI